MKRGRNGKLPLLKVYNAVSYALAALSLIVGLGKGLASYFRAEARWREGFMLWGPLFIGLGIAIAILVLAQLVGMFFTKGKDT